MLLTVRPLFIFKIWMTKPATVLISTMLLTPQPPLLPQFRMTNEALLFWQIMLIAPKALFLYFMFMRMCFFLGKQRRWLRYKKHPNHYEKC